ncbi:N-acetylmuramoyl-L-alanine amidase [Candidatus Pelagibacter sp.]|nr:N-acetylmuramoyl-L-alanine amidase [Candidatus Pelagibacter sp.]
MSINYSPNFNSKKRRLSKLKYLIFHYTGMKSEKAAIKRLTNINSGVSCHYFIKKSGKIIKMVPDLYVAWHAGNSSWKKDKLLNSSSIGIEISNPGHSHGYENFSRRQIISVINLSKKLKKKYKIKKENILGHSDIAPLRKKDPGEKFPWKLLYKKKLSLWHTLKEKKCKKLRNLKLKNTKNFYNKLFKFGYKSTSNSDEKIKIYKSFQRRFRPELISSIVDEETHTILKSLI